MKKIFLAIVSLFVVSTTSSFAGDNDFIYFAPKISFGLSNYTGTIGSAFKGSVSGGIAIGVDLPILGVIEASAIYGSAGAKIEDIDYGTDSDYISGSDATVRSQYIHIPIVYKMSILGGLHAYAGPQFDFLVGQKLKFDKATFDTDFLKNKTISGVVGAGYDFSGGLGVAFNYNFGFTNATVSSITSSLIENAKNPKNKNMSIVFSYRF